ncbi:MAG: hypothetical protein M1825_004986 [Sarcosagium campestre]|nr:MAG: hypothetical protein M1825_004986 [Sarcosagium campestre]
MRRPAHNTTKLPRELLDGLTGESDRNPSQRARRPHSGKGIGSSTRKARRKEERDSKGSRRTRPSQPTGTRSQQDRGYSDELDKSQTPKRQIPEDPSLRNEELPKPKSILKRPKLEPEAIFSNKAHKAGARQTLLPAQPRNRRLEEDDAEITMLEKKLGLKGKSKLPKSFEDDGLDVLLEGIDNAIIAPSSNTKRGRAEIEWLQRKRRKADGFASVSDFSDDDASEVSEIFSEGIGSSIVPDSEESGDEEEFAGFDSDEPRPTPVSKLRKRENPYVAPQTASSTETPPKYVPPSLRQAPASETESLARLQRQAQGLLNRLSAANLAMIVSDVEQLYRQNPRQHVTSTIVDLLVGLLRDKAQHIDTFLILHAGFITAIYKIMGTDFAAAMIVRLIEEFDRAYAVEQQSGERGGDNLLSGSGNKQCINVVSLIAELYKFQFVGSTLVFELLRLFLEELSEFNTELILRIVMVAGPQLRQDDPSALKDVILILQSAIAKVGKASLSTRTNFMIETIDALKNNRMKTGSAASAVTSESTLRMKKTLGSLNGRSIRASEPVRFGLRDIRNIDKRGKWWLVGASYKDDVDAITQESRDLNNPVQPEVEIGVTAYEGTSDLLRLAREQRMNTDVRRAIFIAITSASDYQDAEFLLTKLRLRKAQEVEIPKVIIHCSGAEQVYNPYYTLIARKLCSQHRLKMAFQFSLWDLFKKMGEHEDGHGQDGSRDDEDEELMPARKVMNLAKMFGALISADCLGIGVLKKLNFAYLQQQTRMFMEVLFITIFLDNAANDEATTVNIFKKVDDNAQLARGLQFFLKTVVRKTDIVGDKADKEKIRRGCRLANDIIVSILSTIVGEG